MERFLWTGITSRTSRRRNEETILVSIIPLSVKTFTPSSLARVNNCIILPPYSHSSRRFADTHRAQQKRKRGIRFQVFRDRHRVQIDRRRGARDVVNCEVNAFRVSKRKRSVASLTVWANSVVIFLLYSNRGLKPCAA